MAINMRSIGLHRSRYSCGERISPPPEGMQRKQIAIADQNQFCLPIEGHLDRSPATTLPFAPGLHCTQLRP